MLAQGEFCAAANPYAINSKGPIFFGTKIVVLDFFSECFERAFGDYTSSVRVSAVALCF